MVPPAKEQSKKPVGKDAAVQGTIVPVGTASTPLRAEPLKLYLIAS